jgi:peptidoglycan hydrolase-like protein with peptidoglycan-binding domain
MALAGRDLWSRGGWLCAAAAGAAALLPAPATAAPATTTLKLSGPKPAVPPGGKATLTATLRAAGKPLSGKGIAFLAAGAPAGQATTNSRGKARLKVTLAAPTAYTATYTPAAPDAPAYAPAQSEALQLAPSARLTVSVRSYLRAGRRAVGIPGQRVRVRGTLTPATPGTPVEISLFRKNRRVQRKTVTLKQAGQAGRFAVSVKPKRRGVHRVRVRQGQASGSARLFVVRPRARAGSRGVAVRALQRRLKDLGYLVRVSGRHDGTTSRAVLAFRKVNGFARTTSAGRAVFRRLARGGGGFKLRYPGAGKHAEFDWSRQVLVLARRGRPVIILHTSSGTSATPTVMGKYRFYRKAPGYNSKGMYYSSYFIGGYAIHGYSPVPTFPASHGCLRIPIASAKRVYGWVNLGDVIYTYR